MRQLRSSLVAIAIACCLSGTAHAVAPTDPAAETPTTIAAEPPGPDVVIAQVPPPIANPGVLTSPLVVVPVGCGSPPPAPVAVFVGTLIDADVATGRFAIDQIRAGTLDGYAVGSFVDVRYDDDIRFLRTGQQYLVGVAPDRLTAVLSSKVRVPPLLFGGDAVIGADDVEVDCPRIEDGVKTLRVDGSGVDTGVLAPLKTAKRSMLNAVVKPLGVALVVLLFLAAAKLLVVAMVRAVRDFGDDHVVAERIRRERRHVDAEASSGEIVNSGASAEADELSVGQP